MPIDTQVEAVLRALAKHRNVLLTGPPGAGKSRIMAEVAKRFATRAGQGTAFAPGGTVLFPPQEDLPDWFPARTRTQPKVWSMTFHQDTKYRDFVYGILPKLGVGQTGFSLTRGTLLLASEHAQHANGASLITIDEINRGPAVSVFGDAITAIEVDKRLNESGEETHLTAFMQTVGDDGQPQRIALPSHLYILAAMNEADTSIAPLDVAFRRRFYPIEIQPEEGALAAFLGLLTDTEPPQPGGTETPEDIYRTVVAAWREMNRKLAIVRGPAYQLGHGALMATTPPDEPTKDGALAFATACWHMMKQHVQEILFDDVRLQAEVLGASATSPLKMVEHSVGEQDYPTLEGPTIGPANVLAALRSMARLAQGQAA
ncbi:MAG: AAA family ATPase [bacterium]